MGSTIFDEIVAHYDGSMYPERKQVIGRLRLRFNLLKKMGKATGYQTLHDELILRLLERLSAVIPWDEPYDARFMLSCSSVKAESSAK